MSRIKLKVNYGIDVCKKIKKKVMNLHSSFP